MFDIGWSELLILGVVAILVVGPKDLPRMMRVVGQYVGKARSMAREFRRHVDEAIEEAELEDVKKVVQDVGSNNPLNEIENSIRDMKRDAEADISKDWGEPSDAAKNFGRKDTQSQETKTTPAQETETTPGNGSAAVEVSPGQGNDTSSTAPLKEAASAEGVGTNKPEA